MCILQWTKHACDHLVETLPLVVSTCEVAEVTGTDPYECPFADEPEFLTLDSICAPCWELVEEVTQDMMVRLEEEERAKKEEEEKAKSTTTTEKKDEDGSGSPMREVED